MTHLVCASPHRYSPLSIELGAPLINILPARLCRYRLPSSLTTEEGATGTIAIPRSWYLELVRGQPIVTPPHTSPTARKAPPAGLEPATSRVETGCSNPLSYGGLAVVTRSTPAGEARGTQPVNHGCLACNHLPGKNFSALTAFAYNVP